MKVLCLEGPVAGTQHLGFQHYPKELFQIHAVIAKESSNGKGCCRQYADPACGFFAQAVSQKQVHTSGNTNGQHSADKLSYRQAKEYRFFVLPYLFRDFNFDSVHLLKVRKIDSFSLK